ncbi:hypothetical protein [Allorhizocola rhizosphaerae]|uniref:hypothetical protein n=1 Tax=Allorhizocola rhizosphaerae TaxID=1872709 RepID=UPI0013C2ED10|nr:hypothetical protein [Allorhizocola rhizosphaerae]
MVLVIAGSPYAGSLAREVMPSVMVAVCAGQILALVGWERAEQAEMLLLGLTVRIDGDGIRWSAPSPRSLPWEQIRFVVLARSRLWVGGPDASPAPDADRPDWVNYLHRLVRPHAFALDVPLDVLDQSRAELARAIREASEGRFPTGVEQDGRI